MQESLSARVRMASSKPTIAGCKRNGLWLTEVMPFRLTMWGAITTTSCFRWAGFSFSILLSRGLCGGAMRRCDARLVVRAVPTFCTMSRGVPTSRMISVTWDGQA